MVSLAYSVLGLLAGVLSGLVGIGGGIIIVPALVYLFGFSQQAAQGTTLALMVPPIGLLAAWEYYNKGYVDIRVSLLVILGFVLGGWLGSKLALSLPTTVLRKVFGIVLLLLATKILFEKS